MFMFVCVIFLCICNVSFSFVMRFVVFVTFVIFVILNLLFVVVFVGYSLYFCMNLYVCVFLICFIVVLFVRYSVMCGSNSSFVGVVFVMSFWYFLVLFVVCMGGVRFGIISVCLNVFDVNGMMLVSFEVLWMCRC